jgi:hypothetical protein
MRKLNNYIFLVLQNMKIHTNYSQVDSFFMKDIMQVRCSNAQVFKCKIASKCPLTIKGES